MKFSFKYGLIMITLFIIGRINMISLDYSIVHIAGLGLWIKGFIILSILTTILIFSIIEFKKSNCNYILKILKFCIIFPITAIFFLLVAQQSILSFGDSITIAGINQKHQEYGIIKNKQSYSSHGKHYELEILIVNINKTITIPTNEIIFSKTVIGDSIFTEYYSNPNGSICIKHDNKIGK